MTRHPFQRASNARDTVRTPFQEVLVREIEAYSNDGQRMSGRRLSQMLGKSGNHISQMLNDGFVPSGPAILEIAEILELDAERTDALIRAAMLTKAGQRSRDQFWINETLRMLDREADKRSMMTEFLTEEGLLGRFIEWKKSRPASRASRRPGGGVQA